MDIVIEGDCYISGRFERTCLGIEDGRIVTMSRRVDGDRRMDFGNKKILPAAIDSHVHFREPGMTRKEDFSSGSLAALHGGVCCVLDMPNTIPPTSTLASIEEKKGLASSKSLVDFGLYAALRPGADIEALSKLAVAFKLYMAGTTGDLLVPSLDSVKEEIARIKGMGKVLAVHAEDEGLRGKGTAKNLNDHMRNRSGDCETSAVKRIVRAMDGGRLHLCHISSKDALPHALGRPGVSVEVTPHHLLLDRDRRLGTYGKVNPPLRTRADRQALFLALKEGRLDTIASDHAPHTVDEKNEDFDFAPSGMPGVETMFPLMLQMVRERHLALSTVLKALCERPGELFGINKGRIEEGYDADLIVVDFMDGQEIKADKMYSKCGWTAFEGMTGVFPKAVLVGGELMMKDQEQTNDRKGRDVVAAAERRSRD